MKLTSSMNILSPSSAARRCSARVARSQPLRISTITTAVILAFAPPAWAASAPKPAEQATKDANAALLQELPFSDKTSFELAHKGFIAPLPSGMIKGEQGNLVWDPTKYDFIKEGAPAPDTVNPSL
ncbi:hypothetical protein LMG26684_03655 [Achromobacter mucicolens]|nr:hypothetical protein [Achromobacter mucicolens]CAB3882465.1 hypothetical protein LMG26684_03655 [Achromobacter mucicolens]